MGGSIHVKICGLTCEADVAACLDAGASAIGINLVAGTPRAVDPEGARRLVASAGDRAETVLVVANLSVPEMRALRAWTGAKCLQLHGDEPPEALLALLPHAYKAVRVGDEADVARARTIPGGYLLVDAKVAGVLGGTGVRVDPALVAPLARERRLCLAGGLSPENVADAIRLVRPFAVDVASGVERPGEPRRKDAARVRAFVAAARAAASATSSA